MKTIHNINIKTLFLFILSSILLIALSSSFALAADGDYNEFAKVMCRVLDIATGTGGKAFAAFAIISVGIGFFTGKVSWGLMIGVAAGIAAIFGAPSIVAAIAGSEGSGDCKCKDPGNTDIKIYDYGCTGAST